MLSNLTNKVKDYFFEEVEENYTDEQIEKGEDVPAAEQAKFRLRKIKEQEARQEAKNKKAREKAIAQLSKGIEKDFKVQAEKEEEKKYLREEVIVPIIPSKRTEEISFDIEDINTDNKNTSYEMSSFDESKPEISIDIETEENVEMPTDISFESMDNKESEENIINEDKPEISIDIHQEPDDIDSTEDIQPESIDIETEEDIEMPTNISFDLHTDNKESDEPSFDENNDIEPEISIDIHQESEDRDFVEDIQPEDINIETEDDVEMPTDISFESMDNKESEENIIDEDELINLIKNDSVIDNKIKINNKPSKIHLLVDASEISLDMFNNVLERFYKEHPSVEIKSGDIFCVKEEALEDYKSRLSASNIHTETNSPVQMQMMQKIMDIIQNETLLKSNHKASSNTLVFIISNENWASIINKLAEYGINSVWAYNIDSLKEKIGTYINKTVETKYMRDNIISFMPYHASSL